MKKKPIVLALAGVAILMAVLLTAWPRPKPEVLYEVVFLPTLGRSVSPRAINDQGQVVGVAEVMRNQWSLFLWDREGGMKDLGPCANGRTLINNAGQIAATAVDPNGRSYAFLQDPDGTRYPLRTRAGEQAFVHALNRRGQLVGYSVPTDSYPRAFLWDRTRGMQSLALSGMIESFAAGINDVGQVVGYASRNQRYQWRASLWDPNTGVQDLGPSVFGPTGICHINQSGLVVGQFGSLEDYTCISTWTPGQGAQRAFFLQRASVRPFGLNDAGRFLVVTSRDRLDIKQLVSLEHFDSYLCDPDGRVTDLASCLNLPNVYDFFATGINNQGQITGLLRLSPQANPQGVVLMPVKK